MAETRKPESGRGPRDFTASGKLARTPEKEVPGVPKPQKPPDETIRKIVRSKGPRGEDGIYVAGEVMGQELNMMIDTGSSVSIMSLDMWNQLKLPGMKMRKTTNTLTNVEGAVMQTYCRREIVIWIGKVQLAHDLEIGDCQDGIILGMDFIKIQVLEMNFEDLTIKIGGSK